MDADSALQKFSGTLKALWAAAGEPVYGSLLNLEGLRISDTSLSDWINGGSTPSSVKTEYFFALIRHLNAQAKGRSTGYVPMAEGQWSMLLNAARAEKDGKRGGRPPKPQTKERVKKDASRARRDQALRSHRAWIEQFVLPDQLQGRGDELRALKEFCTAPDGEGPGYLWWQAGPWAGKSALMAEFVIRHQPASVEIVSYSIGDHLGNNDRDSFLQGVSRQLGAVAGSDTASVGSRPEDLLEHYRSAAEACRQRGRRLVLVVDGLDEDRDAGLDGLSIAALLPRHLPSGMRVVVTGRPNPLLPHDVHESHPLQIPGIIRPLTASPAARGIKNAAERELRRLLEDQPVGNGLLGLLAVARGGLTGNDLAELVNEQTHEISKRLRGITGRSIIPEDRDHTLGDDAKAGTRPYVLGHTELLGAALDGLGAAAMAAYEARLHEWANGYRDRNWPSNTPSYLLYDYTGMLRLKGDTKRLVSFVLAPGRRRVLLDRGSVDTALSEVELTRKVVQSEAPDDLATMAALAASRDMLAERTKSLPLSMVSAFAELGDAQRAMSLARSSPHPAVRASRLAHVARVLVSTDHEHAAKAAQEAAEWAQQARQEATPDEPPDAEIAAGEAAVALISVGQDRQGRELLNSLKPHPNGDDTLPCEMMAEAAAAARPQNPALAEELLDQAEQWANELRPGRPPDHTTPITAWVTVAGAASPERAARLSDRISEYAREYPACLESVDVLAAAASALAADRPDEAATLAQQAGQRLRAALRAPESLPSDDAFHLGFYLGDMLTSVTRALVGTGAADEVRNLVAAVPETRRVDVFGEDKRDGARVVIGGVPRGATKHASAEALAQQACRLADEGEPDAAKSRLYEAMEVFARSPEGVSMGRSWLMPLAGALAAVGDLATSERLARSIGDSGAKGQALAVVSRVCGTAGHIADARRLAHEAADLSSALEGADDYSLLNGAPGINVAAVKAAAAHALAFVGEIDRASRLVGEGESRLALAAGLRKHAPDRAARLLQEARDSFLASHEDRARRLGRSDVSPVMQQRLTNSAWSGLVTRHVSLLVAAGTTDRTCRDWLRQALREALSRPQQARSPQDELVIVILAARSRPDWARRKLRWLQEEADPHSYPEVLVGCAVAHAVLGDLTAAWDAAHDHVAPVARGAAGASVAAYLARVPADLFDAIIPSGSDSFRRVLHTLALMQTNGKAPDLDQSRRFLSTALASDGWHHALAPLAHIAPEAVKAVTKVSF